MTKDNKQYIALARKYRPQKFEDLLGQDALVQTLTNAIKNNRLHHTEALQGCSKIARYRNRKRGHKRLTMFAACGTI